MKVSHRLHSIDRIRKLAIAGMEWQEWYSIAQTEIATVCKLENWNVEETTSKLAILSPKISVVRNVRAWLAYCGQGSLLIDITGNVKRSLANYEKRGTIGGYKVPYFRKALLGNTQSITLDTWIAYAMIASDKYKSVASFRRKATRLSAIKRIQTVADSLSISPRDCQACIWCGTFLAHNKIPAFYPILREYKLWVEGYNREFPLSGAIGNVPDNNPKQEIADSLEPDSDSDSDIAFSFGSIPAF